MKSLFKILFLSLLFVGCFGFGKPAPIDRPELVSVLKTPSPLEINGVRLYFVSVDGFPPIPFEHKVAIEPGVHKIELIANTKDCGIIKRNFSIETQKGITYLFEYQGKCEVNMITKPTLNF